MKKIYGFVVGTLVGSMAVSGFTYAKSAMETISVRYDNIKVYKDNVLCDLRDSNGTKVEPFIYNGTTYLPLRSTADLAGMGVTWDGNTKSVYLWDEVSAGDTNLMEVCPPYEMSFYMRGYLQNKGQSFEMAGKKYSNGIRASWVNEHASFNLDGKYSTMNLTVGRLDGISGAQTVTFIVDGKVVEEVELPEDNLPKTISVPLQYGLQLKIVASYAGLGNITVN